MARAADADRLLTAALRSLDALAGLGDARARHAAALLRGVRSPGRTPINDDTALADVARLMSVGRRHSAVSAVARLMARSPLEAAAIGRRLRRKLKLDGQNYIRPSRSEPKSAP